MFVNTVEHQHSKLSFVNYTVSKCRFLQVDRKLRFKEAVIKNRKYNSCNALMESKPPKGKVTFNFDGNICKMVHESKIPAQQPLKEAKISNSVSFLCQYDKIEEEYEDYIISAEAARKSFSIVFSAPEMTRFDSNFKDFLVITDVAYKTIKDGYYLCSSVMYVAHLRNHIVIFQATIGGLSAKFFQKYFELFFKHFDIQSSYFLGSLMDFPSVQRKGFLDAFEIYFTTPGDPPADGRPFLKSCYMH
ncbi:unnamed protein product [Mucor hiemalis]